MDGQASRRSEVTRSASEGTRRRGWASLWVVLLLAILGFLVAPAVRAADLPYAGTWKVSMLNKTFEVGYWLLKIDKEGKKVS